MKNAVLAIAAAAVIAGGAMTSMPTPANARCYGCAVGAGVAAGVIGGAIIGGAIANSRRHYYYAEPPVYDGPPDDAVAYCMRQFKSYDPRTGTYLGYDGYRHPCP